MSTFLFTVEERFIVPERGLVLVPQSTYKSVHSGDSIRLILPDKSTCTTVIKGIVLNEPRSILVGGNFTKEDIPIGTEVWLESQ